MAAEMVAVQWNMGRGRELAGEVHGERRVQGGPFMAGWEGRWSATGEARARLAVGADCGGGDAGGSKAGGYKAPEMQSMRRCSMCMDVYAFGILPLVEFLMGRKPSVMKVVVLEEVMLEEVPWRRLAARSSGRALLHSSGACAGGWAWSHAPSLVFPLRGGPPSPHLRQPQWPGARFGGCASPSPLLPSSSPCFFTHGLWRSTALQPPPCPPRERACGGWQLGGFLLVLPDGVRVATGSPTMSSPHFLLLWFFPCLAQEKRR
jgi:hypothetical protein